MKNRKAERRAVLAAYSAWYRAKLLTKPDLAEDYYLKDYSKHIKHGSVVLSRHKALGKTFVEFCNFVFKKWATCDNSSIAYWVNWLGSKKILKEFKMQVVSEKAKGAAVTNHTYSDHSGVGVSRDRPAAVLGPVRVG